MVVMLLLFNDDDGVHGGQRCDRLNADMQQHCIYSHDAVCLQLYAMDESAGMMTKQ